MSRIAKYWTPALAGFVAAFAVMGWLRPIPIRVSRLGDVVIVYALSIFYVLLATAVSAVTAWLTWRIISWLTRDKRMPQFTWRISSRAAWIVPLLLFLLARSRWALLAGALAILGLVHVLRILQPAVKQSPALTSGWKVFTCVIAGAAIEAGCIAAGAERIGLAVLAAVVAASILAWHATRPGPRGHAARGLITVFTSIVFTAAVLVRSAVIGPNDGLFGFPVDPALTASVYALQSVFWETPQPVLAAMGVGKKSDTGRDADPTIKGLAHRGIYLWPEKKKETTLVPPLPSLGRKMFGQNSITPLTIPFYGAYWFYQPPDQKPPINSITLYGSPAVQHFLSNDHSPLWQEAHQNLLRTFETSCCSRIEVDVTNADRNSSQVEVEVYLADNTKHPQALESLGRQQLLTKPETVAVPETLSFKVPAVARVKGFDEISVRFRMKWPHMADSAQVAIERFRLVPRRAR